MDESSPIVIGLLLNRDSGYGKAIERGVQRFLDVNPSWRITFVDGRRLTGRLTWAKPFHGLVAMPDSAPILDLLLATGLPLIATSTRAGSDRAPTLVPDWQAAGQMAGEHLLLRGFRSFAYAGTGREDPTGNSRFQGLANALRQAGLPPPRALIGLHQETAWRQTLTMLPKPVAILATVDARGRDVLEVARRAALTIPQELAVMGFDDDAAICERCQPTLSSVDTGGDRVGFLAMGLLRRHLIKGEALRPGLTTLPPTGIVERGSTANCATSDLILAQAQDHLWRHYHQELDIGSLALRLRIARRTLEHRFRQHFGRSPYALLLEIRHRKAGEMLAGSDLPVAAIAHRVGFRDAAQFAVSFRKRFGCSPSQWRQQELTGGP